MNSLNVDSQFRYIVQWFNEWSEFQREDFIPVFVEYIIKDTSDSGENNGGVVYMNGVVNAVVNANLIDKPLSLFQCRIKLFREWSPKWPVEFKLNLQERITEIDTKIGEKIVEEIRSHNGGGHPIVNGIDAETVEPEDVAATATNEAITIRTSDDNDDNGQQNVETVNSIAATVVVITAADAVVVDDEPKDDGDDNGEQQPNNIVDNDLINQHTNNETVANVDEGIVNGSDATYAVEWKTGVQII